MVCNEIKCDIGFMIKWLNIVVLMLTSMSLSGQDLTQDQIDYLNKEIRFINESIHRMVIIFQIYENYNSQITDHVDLPSHPGLLNTSSHLPKDLFSATEFSLTKNAPSNLYREMVGYEGRRDLPLNSWSLITQAKAINDRLTADRSEIDHIVENEDLHQFGNVQRVFNEIEEVREVYDRLRNVVKTYEKIYTDVYFDLSLAEDKANAYKALVELHFDIKKLVRQLRRDDRSEVINTVSKLEKELKWLSACISRLSNPEEQNELRSAVVSIELLIVEIKNYVNGVEPPNEYRSFGKGYYYHNYQLLPKINQYGSGYVWKLQEFFKKYKWPVLDFLEEPHYLKVVYPERIPLEIMKGDKIAADQDIREMGPSGLPALEDIVVSKVESPPSPPKESKKTPPLNIVHSESIKVDSLVFNLELYDHYMKDGDRVSINVNGEWIHQRISLEGEHRILDLSVNPGQTNRILIQAVNQGWRPPLTIGIKYLSKDESRNVYIKKDLKLNEVIEIKYSL